MHRRTLLLGGLATLPSLALASVGSAAPNRRKPGPKRKPKPKPRKQPYWVVVTHTFSNLEPVWTPSTSGPFDSYPWTIPVGGFPSGIIEKVTVTLHGFYHRYPDEIDLMLVAPNGRAAVFMSDAGGLTMSTPVTLTFDDHAFAPVPNPLLDGTYLPTNLASHGFAVDPFSGPAPAGVTGSALSVFNDGDPNGTWSLYGMDDLNAADFQGGSIDGWSLTIRARVKLFRKVKRKPKTKPKPRRRRR